jgi:hypothetical protein
MKGNPLSAASASVRLREKLDDRLAALAHGIEQRRDALGQDDAAPDEDLAHVFAVRHRPACHVCSRYSTR